MLYDKIADLVGNPRVPVVLVGNKKDLEVKRRNLVLNINNEHLLDFSSRNTIQVEFEFLAALATLGCQSPSATLEFGHKE